MGFIHNSLYSVFLMKSIPPPEEVLSIEDASDVSRDIWAVFVSSHRSIFSSTSLSFIFGGECHVIGVRAGGRQLGKMCRTDAEGMLYKENRGDRVTSGRATQTVPLP